MKFIIGNKTIINFNYNWTTYFAQGKRDGYKMPNIANLQTDIIILYFRLAVFVLMIFLNGDFIYGIAKLTDLIDILISRHFK